MTIQISPPEYDLPATEALLCLVAAGDRDSFSELYAVTSSRVYGIIRRVLVDIAQSEEVTQEVFLEVWQGAKNYDPSLGSAIAWLVTISYRRAIDRVRASQSSQVRDHRVGLRDHVAEFDTVAETVEIRLEYERARRAMRSITTIQREAITLAYWDGLSASEIAVQLGINVSTVKTRLRDGLIRMRAEMDTESRPFLSARTDPAIRLSRNPQ